VTWPAEAGPVPEAVTAMEPLMLDPDGPSVVAIGGGHGLAAALEAIQLYAGEVTAVVSVADDGGSSGRLMQGLGIPAPGDIRRCLLALTPEPTLATELFAHRFVGGDVSDHSLGNLMLAALTELFGDFGAAVDAAGSMLGAIGDVVPATTSPVALRAVVDGVTVDGQAVISKTRGTLEAIELVPGGVETNLRALEAIADADQIVIGPGSLVTSVVAALLVPDLAAAVSGSRAQLVFVSNLVTQNGETLGLDGPGHLEMLARFGGVDGIGVVVAHEGVIDVPAGLAPVTFDAASVGGWAIERADVALPGAEWPEHDPMALAGVLEKLLE
jgi:uncharacterized cofD-like protein